MKNKHYKGLRKEQVEENRRKYGMNIVTPFHWHFALKELAEKLNDTIVRLMLLALLASFVLAALEYFSTPMSGGFNRSGDAGVFLLPLGILVAILLVVGVGYWLEYRCECAFRKIAKADDRAPVKVLRNGCLTETERRSIVVGDLVFISEGDEVPADGELLEAVRLVVDESQLSGGKKVAKQSPREGEESTATQYVLRGSKVLRGHGIFRVQFVGNRTQYHGVYVHPTIDNSNQSPLNQRTARLERLMNYVGYALAVAIVVLRTVHFLSDGASANLEFWSYFVNTLLLALTMVVCIVPEGLSMSSTLALALSMRQLRKASILVRKSAACETMGRCSVVCVEADDWLLSDDRSVAASHILGIDGQQLGTDKSSRLISEGIAVNTMAWLDISDYSEASAVGDPTEAALLKWLWKKSTDKSYEMLRLNALVVDRLLYSSERRYSATEVFSGEVPGARIVYVCGDALTVLSMSADTADGSQREVLEQEILTAQQNGLYTVGFACQELNATEKGIDGETCVSGHLTFQGYMSIALHERDDVLATLAEFEEAGVEVKIVTQKPLAVAKVLAENISHLSDGETVSASDLRDLSDDELQSRLEHVRVVGDALPSDKERIAVLLKAVGHTVAVTGTTVADIGLLEKADVGLTSGSSPQMVKDASDITLLNGEFQSAAKAVMWGRSVYLNIRRFIMFQLSVSILIGAVILLSAVLSVHSPLNAIQLLWVNLIMDTFGAIALASLPASQGIMRRKAQKKKDTPLVTRGMWMRIGAFAAVGFVLLVGLLFAFSWFEVGSNLLDWSARAEVTAFAHLNGIEESAFSTLFVFFLLMHLFNSRTLYSDKGLLAGLGKCTGLLLVAAIIVVVQVMIVYFGGDLFGTAPMGWIDWILIVVASMIVLSLGFLR